eukprot:TRINITY_DN13749_c0_g1_i1.p1 TRINITY_DN13749_c0_g1~~TRINITY_DN13749_c0_g1_i1.p1  ORF type:complete len:624 (-),score=106.01 TRINITY_DN13749_c0_g1_i1:140-1939(-)
MEALERSDTMRPRMASRTAAALRRRPASGAAVLIGCCLAPHPAKGMFGEHIPEGCYTWSVSDEAATEFVKLPAENLTAPGCQEACAAKPGCHAFTYHGGSKPSCHHAVGDKTTKLTPSAEALSGPARCEDPARVCRELPRGPWPGRTPEESNKAWPTHYQPQNLQCWPRHANLKLKNCPSVVVVEDTANGWPGACLGLNLQKEVFDTDGCEKHCREDVECSTWAWTNEEQCWTGHGHDCYSTVTARPLKAQRLKRGSSRILKKLEGIQVMGLHQVFDHKQMKSLRNVLRDPVSLCRDTCLSDVGCEYWQLLQESGCWVEMPHIGSAPFPLTMDSLGTSEDPVLAGEYLQRYCPELFNPLKPTEEPEALLDAVRQATKASEAPVLIDLQSKAPNAEPAVATPAAAEEPASGGGFHVWAIALTAVFGASLLVVAALVMGPRGIRLGPPPKMNKRKPRDEDNHHLEEEPPQRSQDLLPRVDVHDIESMTATQFSGLGAIGFSPKRQQDLANFDSMAPPVPTHTLLLPAYQQAMQPPPTPTLQSQYSVGSSGRNIQRSGNFTSIAPPPQYSAGRAPTHLFQTQVLPPDAGRLSYASVPVAATV